MAKFSKGFMVGAATAAHQVEGNNVHSDYWVQENIEHSSFVEPSGEAVDHYHRYEEDIRLLAEAGLNTYRFSIEWARIQPGPDTWDEAEIEHYRKVIDCCLANDVKPIATMMHFTSPAWVIGKGGWENPEVADWFAAYCRKVVEALGDKLEYVCTINEANMRLQLAAIIEGMMKRMQAPQEESKAAAPKEGDVQVGLNLGTDMQSMMQGMMETAQAFGIADPRGVHTFVSQCTPEGDILVMKAHQAAKAAIKEACPHLKVGLTLSIHDTQAYPGGEAHAAKEWDDEFSHYLPYIKDDDFLGVQSYSRKRFNADGVAPAEPDERVTQMGYEDYPMAIAHVVRRVADEFKGELIVTENGIATADDKRRCEFIEEATDGIAACVADGIPVKGYMYWSLLDNVEWQKGFGMTFGLIAVDRSTQTRYPKESLRVLGAMAEK